MNATRPLIALFNKVRPVGLPVIAGSGRMQEFDGPGQNEGVEYIQKANPNTRDRLKVRDRDDSSVNMNKKGWSIFGSVGFGAGVGGRSDEQQTAGRSSPSSEEESEGAIIGGGYFIAAAADGRKELLRSRCRKVAAWHSVRFDSSVFEKVKFCWRCGSPSVSVLATHG